MEKTNDVLKFAKQGNAKAIEAIFSKQLSASNIAVKAVVRNGCLQIMFEAKQALSQVTMVNGVKKVLTQRGTRPRDDTRLRLPRAVQRGVASRHRHVHVRGARNQCFHVRATRRDHQ